MSKHTDPHCLSLMGRAPRKIPHVEHWSCPDAETCLTGIGSRIPWNVTPEGLQRCLDLSAVPPHGASGSPRQGQAGRRGIGPRTYLPVRRRRASTAKPASSRPAEAGSGTL